MAQRSITDIVESLEEYVKENVSIYENSNWLQRGILEYCQEIKDKAHDLAVDLTN